MNYFIEQCKYNRIWGSSNMRTLYVAVFVLSLVAVVLAILSGHWTWVNYFNSIFLVFYGWMGWPTMTNTSGGSSDNSSNS